MARYHIKKDGTPGICHAQPGKCPLGGMSQHYASAELAQQAADAQHLENFSKNAENKIQRFTKKQMKEKYNNMVFKESDMKTTFDKLAADALLNCINDKKNKGYVFGINDYYGVNAEDDDDYINGLKGATAVTNETVTDYASSYNLIGKGEKIVTAGQPDYMDKKHELKQKAADIKKYKESTKGKSTVTLPFAKVRYISPNIAKKLEYSKMRTSYSGFYIQHKDGTYDKLDDTSTSMLTNMYCEDNGGFDIPYENKLVDGLNRKF